MTLIDFLGINALNLDKKLLKLVGQVEVMRFRDIGRIPGDVGDKIALGRRITLMETYNTVRHFGLNYLVQEQDEQLTYNLLMTAIIQKYPDAFLKNPIPTMLRSTKAHGVNEISIPFSSSKQKAEVMSKTFQFLDMHPRLGSLKTNISLIINELMMNALYCAPVDEQGHYLYRDSDRSVDVAYPEGVNAEITLSFNTEILVVGCRDPYGSVEKPVVTQRLHEVFQGDQKAKIQVSRSGSGGSGLGLKMTIEESTGFGMVVKQSQETFVYAILPLGRGNRAITRTPKNLALKFF